MNIYIFIFIAIFTGGLIFLSISANLLVRAASRFAKTLGISSFMVGATIVAYGTSLPEFVVSTLASYQNAGPLALGNVVGSNLLNTGLILGLAALISPIIISKQLSKHLFRQEIPFFIGLTLVTILMALGDSITREMGTLLLGIIGVYLLITLRQGIKQRAQKKESRRLTGEVVKKSDYFIYGFGIIFGLAGLVVSAEIMVDSAMTIATLMGVSQRLIGLTIVALGTSLPELAAAIAAGIRKKTGLILGNLIGSNLFNLGMILGPAAIIRPIPIEASSRVLDFSFLGINAILVSLFLFFGKGLGKVKGTILVVFYMTFAILLIF